MYVRSSTYLGLAEIDVKVGESGVMILYRCPESEESAREC